MYITNLPMKNSIYCITYVITTKLRLNNSEILLYACMSIIKYHAFHVGNPQLADDTQHCHTAWHALESCQYHTRGMAHHIAAWDWPGPATGVNRSLRLTHSPLLCCQSPAATSAPLPPMPPSFLLRKRRSRWQELPFKLTGYRAENVPIQPAGYGAKYAAFQPADSRPRVLQRRHCYPSPARHYPNCTH